MAIQQASSSVLHSILDRSTSSLRMRWFVILLALALSACERSPELTAPDPLAAAQPVRVAPVETAPDTIELRLPAVTRAVERADLSFLHGGQLAERLVERGQFITVGEPLAILHNPALMPGVTSAAARLRELDRQLEQLERDTKRLENLHERGLVSTDELDRTRSRRDALIESRQAAEANLAEARDQLEEGTLRAPFSGKVVEFHAEPGQYVNPGQPVMSMATGNRLEVAANIPAQIAAGLMPGQFASIGQVDGTLAARAEITEIGLAEPGRPASLILTLPDGDDLAWQPGLPVQVTLRLPAQGGVQVPLAALISPAAGSPRVFILRNGRAEKRSIEPGRLRDGKVTVAGQLDAGDEVIVAGHGRLLDGERVRVLQ